jgi:RHS repeat-associated protein
MIYDASKKMTVSYDYRGLPTAFAKQELSGDSVRLLMTYDGAGNRISKRYERKAAAENAWTLQLATHYTGLGSEIRENGLDNTAKVVVNLPQGFGRYSPSSASENVATFVPSFEWYLKNHLGSTMLVYGTGSGSGSVKAAYDYRAFGEQVSMVNPSDKVTENFTGKELDDETGLGYFGARYLDQMLGMWVSVDTKRQFNSPYEYAGNNPISMVDPDGNAAYLYAIKLKGGGYSFYAEDDKGSKSISGSFNTHTSNYNQLGVGSYTITPRPYLNDVGIGTWLLNALRGRDVNEHAGRPSISNTGDWNTVKNADGSLTHGAQVHPGRGGTANGMSLACMVTDLQTYNQLKGMFDNNYNDGGVFLDILPEGASLPEVEVGDPEPNGNVDVGDPIDITYSP